MDIYFQSFVCFLLHINITYLLAKLLDIELLGQRICEFVILIRIVKLPSRSDIPTSSEDQNECQSEW